MNAGAMTDEERSADTERPSGLETPSWLRAANAEGLLRVAYTDLADLRMQVANLTRLIVDTRAMCVEACLQTARELSEEGDQAAGFGALRCADAIRGRR